MKAAILTSLFGLTFTFYLGTQFLHLDYSNLMVAILASNLASFISLIVTLQVERQDWFKKLQVLNSMKTWFVLTSLYLLIMLSLNPSLRTLNHLALLLIPLILSTGFAILAFGPVQDWIVRRQQKRLQTMEQLAPQTPTLFESKN